MKYLLPIALGVLLWGEKPLLAQAAPEGTPERAIQDLALAAKPQDIERHLPVATMEAVKTLSAEDRRAFEMSLAWQDTSERASVEVPEDGHAFLVIQSPKCEANVQLTESITTGVDAVLRFAFEARGGPPPFTEVQAWMRMEEGEWRIRELDYGPWQRIRFDDPEFVEKYRNREQKAAESSAISTLYTLHYSLQRFAEARSDVGFPDDLTILAEPRQDDADDNGDAVSTSFLSPEMAHNDFDRAGYHVHYQLIRGGPLGAYQITARPLNFEKSMRLSYLINETADIHQTAEDRDATSDDPVMGNTEEVTQAVE